MNPSLNVNLLSKLILLSILPISLLAQNPGMEVMGKRGLKTDKSPDIISKIKMNYYLIETAKSENQKAVPHHCLASIYYLTDAPNDSITYHLDKSLSYDSLWFCKYLTYRKNIPQSEPEFFKKFLDSEEYFVTQLPEKIRQYYLSKCISICGDCEKEENRGKNKAKINVAYESALKKMMELDQKYRSLDMTSYGLSLQRELDSQNRIDLDSLYDLYGFCSTKIVGNEAQKSAWFVLHHSNDCEWNKKWIIRFLNAYKNQECSGACGFLGQTFDRFFHPTNGHCNKEESKEFIQLLKETFPKKLGEIYNYGLYSY